MTYTGAKIPLSIHFVELSPSWVYKKTHLSSRVKLKQTKLLNSRLTPPSSHIGSMHFFSKTVAFTYFTQQCVIIVQVVSKMSFAGEFSMNVFMRTLRACHHLKRMI